MNVNMSAGAKSAPETSRADRPPLASITTYRTTVQPNLTIVAIEDADGRVGLGETFYGSSSVEAYVHDVAAPVVRSLHSAAPAAVAAALDGYVGYSGSGAEVRGNSAIDIALWDLMGRRSETPLRELLGGPVRDDIPAYNTCSGNFYVNAESRQSVSNWGIGAGGPADSPNEDLWAFLNRPGDLARELLDQGITGMKVWPFDMVAEDSRGGTAADLSFGMRILDEIRESVGSAMDIYVELHSLWTLRGAERLLKKLERIDPVWVEDPIRPDNVEALSRLHDEVAVPIAVGENLGAGRGSYKALFDLRAADIAIIDLGWGGGVTQGMKTAALADEYGLPVAAHDCTGPISLAVATHLATAVPNAFVQEFSRAFYHGWYQDVVTGLPAISGGRITPADSPGHGVDLAPEFSSADSTRTRRSSL